MLDIQLKNLEKNHTLKGTRKGSSKDKGKKSQNKRKTDINYARNLSYEKILIRTNH